jgi:hypothetical protein
MKKISSLVLALVFAIAAWGQSSTLTITVNGNRNVQLLIDGSSYTLPVNSKKLTVSNLVAGQHTLQVIRGVNPNSKNNNTTSTTSTFIVRNGFNTNVTVNGNKGINIAQAKIKGYKNNRYNSDVAHDAYGNVIYDANGNPVYTNNNGNYGYGIYGNNGNYNRAPMTQAAFNNLYNSVRSKWFLNSKYNSLESAFNNSSNYFTTAQAKQLISLVSDEGNRLALAKISYARIVDPSNFGELYDLLNSQTSKNELDAYARGFNSTYNGNYNGSSNNSSYGYGVYGNNGNYNRAPMTEASFNDLYNSVKATWFQNKFNTVESAFNNNTYYFTTLQAKQLISLISDESNRLALAKLSYARIVDPMNFAQMSDVLNSQSSRNELDTYARGYNSNYNSGYNNQGNGYGIYGNNGNYNRTPMSEAAFNEVYNDVKSKWFFNSKYSTLESAFNNNSYYFTTAQAKQLISLVSDESNRLNLAKLAYARIVDPVNFGQLYDLLATQSSRDELDSYARGFHL